MTKSELIEKLSEKHPMLPLKMVENIVKDILEFMSQSLRKW